MSQAGLIDIEGSHPQIATQYDTDSGTAIPLLNVLEIFGGVGIITSGSGNTVTITASASGLDTACANFIVDPAGTKADYTTIAAAISAASSGDTIFVKEGTYTEALTISKDLTITSFAQSDRQLNNNVIIKGTSGNPAFAVDTNTTLKVTNVRLDPNGANIINLENSGVSVSFVSCKVGMEDGVTTFTHSASGTSNLSLNRCNISGGGTTTAKFLDHSGSPIGTWIIDCWIEQGSGTASTITSTGLQIRNSLITGTEFAISSSANIISSHTLFNRLSGAQNITPITTSGTSNAIFYSCAFTTGTSSAISIGSGTTVEVYNGLVNSSNTNVITGAGTLKYAELTFSGSSSAIDVTTQTPMPIGPDATYSGNRFLGLPLGTTAQRPGSPAEGMIRGNSTLNCAEYFDGTSWACVETDTACANFIVDPAGTKADYTTIASAIAAASSGDTVFIKPGTYTENLTMVAGVNLVSFVGEQRGTNVEIVGKLSASFTGTVIISGLRVVTNGDLAIEVTGANSTILTFYDCFIEAADNQAISLNASSSTLTFEQCRLDVSDGSSKMIDSSAGAIVIRRCNLSASGGTPGDNTISSGNGNMGILLTGSNQSFTTSGSGALLISQCNFAKGNVTAFTCGGTGVHRIEKTLISTGTASALSISAGNTTELNGCGIRSSNTAAITGAGTLQSVGLYFGLSSSNIDVTTQTILREGPSRTIGSSNSGGTNVLTVENSENTSTSSNSKLEVLTGGTSGGDPFLSLNVSGGSAFSLGLDNTDSDTLKLTTGSAGPSAGTEILTITTGSLATLTGSMDIIHTASEGDDHAFEIICNAAGFGDVKALDIDYITGALAAGDDEEVMLVNIDESASTGGEISGYQVLSTAEGSATIHGYVTGININPILHNSGTFGDAVNILNKAVDVTAALASGGAGNISGFVLNTETMTIGAGAEWNEMEIIIGTAASGGGIAPVFAFSTGGTGFTNFSPSDGTNGMKNTGSILWIADDLSGWVANATGRFEIRITRARVNLTTTPILDEIQISSATEFSWDLNGDLIVNDISGGALSLSTDLSVANGGTGASSLTDHGALVGSGTAAITALAVGTDGQILLGSSAADPVFATATSSDSLLTLTLGAGSLDIVAQDAVSSASSLTDNAVVRGNGGATGAQTSTMIISDAGEMTNPSQPAFFASNTVGDANQTGAGTAVTVEFNSERFDQNSDYNAATDTFTAPVTGKYHFNVSVSVSNMTSAMTKLELDLVTTSRTYSLARCNPFAQEDSGGVFQSRGFSFADLTAADTASVLLEISNGAGDTVTISGAVLTTYFSGVLVC